MSYPSRLLNSGEEVALDLRPHWWFFGRQILLSIPLLVGIILYLQIGDGTGKDIAGWVVGLAFVVWAGWVAIKYMSWSRTYFVVTNQRVVFRTGVIARDGVEIPLERINNINFSQRILERMIGAGNLEIQSAGEQGTSHFDFVRYPDAVQQEIYRQMDARQQLAAGFGAGAVADAVAKAVAAQAPAAPAVAATPVADIPAQLEQLARLRDQGVITAEEFERKKAELLDRM